MKFRRKWKKKRNCIDKNTILLYNKTINKRKEKRKNKQIKEMVPPNT